ncbi:RNA polymerase-associated protein RapA [Salinimonas sp. HHU 13199]|uniref:RNA polymerase-associated protein RapA n=1 Tax=Salinimonas profundi TaxID=2729140 RepID=A0ABR8LM68_9ALTE|nr:RNA polymerase-associated protein RapA [Salinimonas profundi]MBD3586031.1 RNA polymerase-associated protein RapA [Salinimonas profundi]
MSSASEYAVGQRWLSNTESELGLGAIVNQDFRSVEVFYPATGESRKYTKNDAPLTRLTFEVGDTIKSQDGWSMAVTDTEISQDVVIYHGTHTDTGETTRLPETMLDHHIRLNQPEQRLFSMQHDIPKWFDLRLKAFTHMSDYQRSQTIGLAGARIELIPHQLHIASQVGNRHAPRVLLADEVGLGKTIEAALIIHQQIKTARAQRVLIVVPDSLVHQWLVEMLRRVNLAFAIFDESRCEAMDESEENPFEQEQLVLCSLDFLRNNAKRHEQALAAGWDLLVVDEAHHLVWSAEAPSADYQCIEALASAIAGVLLLTATPDQLGHESHFARLRLLDPARFHDYDTFLKEESQYSELAEAVTPLLGDDTLTDEEIARIRELAPHSASELTNLDDFDQRDALLHALIDRHGTGRLLFRNRRAGITGFPERHLQAHPLPLPDVYEDMLELTDDLDEALYPERQPSLVNSWTDLDPRVEWLLEFLPTVKPEKVLLICASAVTAQQLGEAIRLRTGIRHSVFHEGMSIVERDKAAHFFADDEEGAQILLCSEIGSEGRNFQFAHHLVLFDLPMTPDLLEQRIGRLDRIGQTKDIQIHVPYLEDTAQSVLLDWYNDGLGAFTQTCPTGTGVFEQVKDQLTECLLVPQDQESRTALVTRTHEINQSLRQQLDAGRDRLLELNASGKGKVEDLLDDIIAQDANDALSDFMNWLFDAIGVNQEDKGNDCFILRPGESMVNSLPGLDPEGMTVTYRRRVATTLEHVHYLSWDHPLVHNAVDVILTDTIGKASLGFIADRTLPKGAYWLEALFTLSVNAPAHLQASRFLPATPIKLCIDAQGEESDTTFEKTRRANKKIAQQLIGALKKPVNNQIDKARELASQQADTLLAQARENMKSSLGAEIERLRELQQDNPAIRDSEIDFIDTQIAALDDAFDDAEVQLDALRIVVNNP